eukprot:Rhum_TRINITY_DN9110_c0_g1::Rhum_TRINITY_DN9110_c0_g1_i1::g.31621::m.31621
MFVSHTFIRVQRERDGAGPGSNESELLPGLFGPLHGLFHCGDGSADFSRATDPTADGGATLAALIERPCRCRDAGAPAASGGAADAGTLEGREAAAEGGTQGLEAAGVVAGNDGRASPLGPPADPARPCSA